MSILFANELIKWILFLVFLGTSYMSYQSYKDGVTGRQFTLGLLHLFISPFFAYSIGPLILGLGLIQIYMSTIQWKNKKAARLFSRIH
ncbi:MULTISPECIES: hypothetical protein [Salimicrobium]|uniref:Uncharacterized protein n=4 Tax=Salimicrobium TaxID=351195 RepID=K2GMX8_9BACI|nr:MULTISPECIES: hypothetical protein [Salimicrobium]AKG04732.1 hypothetical protein AAV35_007910 [Salimicrobium jeotgali]EKE31764.1 hypothetical protein MJ3_06483 [Salimicrobium jeotgali]MBM7696275.1 hypothetical protein [Salimicrobium jeotgali]PBB05146.1 hypothetical protein CKW00_10130 [Salimicrobium humidisoli]SDX36703.1 hypothetical protein SAMN04488081_0301 [Salimicrobium album]